MSLENRLAGPIIFARERSLNYFEQRAREEEKNSEKQSPLPCGCSTAVCCVPYFNETVSKPTFCR